jgi:tyrosyl-tRNA synthetase
LTAEEIEQGFKDVPSHTLSSKDDIGLLDLLLESGVASSKRQAREDIANGAVYVNGERTQELDRVIGAADRIGNRFVILRRGKKNYTLIRYE